MTVAVSFHTLRVKVEDRELAIHVAAALAPVPEEVVVFYLRDVNILSEPVASRPPSMSTGRLCNQVCTCCAPDADA